MAGAGAERQRLGVLMGWKEESIELKKTHSWAETSNIIKERYFPNEEQLKVYEKIKGYIRHQKRKNINTSNTPQSVEYDNGKYTFKNIIKLIEGEEVTPEAMIKAHGLKCGTWEVVAYRNNLWESQIKGGGKAILYQSRLTARPIENSIDFAWITKELLNFKPKTYNPIPHDPGNEIAEVNIADLHLGKLCWQGDTGENYDHKIARDNFRKIISDIYSRLRGRKLDCILFVWTNDFFNSDTINKTTSNDTPQDTDVRWQKLYKVGCEILIEAIETFRMIAPVRTFYTASNHDKMASYYAISFLSAWYRNCSDVEIDTDAYPRKYIEYGVNLIGFAHGDTERGKGTKDKASKLASVMPNEAPQQWGRTKIREMHSAHLHSEQMIQEINGVIVRRISSPTYLDTYHIEGGYVGAQRKAMIFIWDKTKGNTEIFNSYV